MGKIYNRYSRYSRKKTKVNRHIANVQCIFNSYTRNMIGMNDISILYEYVMKD